MTYSHKPTPLQNADPNTDRVICHNGNVIARTYQFHFGPMDGEWRWFGQWIGYDNVGNANTLEEALMIVKERYGALIAR